MPASAAARRPPFISASLAPFPSWFQCLRVVLENYTALLRCLLNASVILYDLYQGYQGNIGGPWSHIMLCN